MSLVDCAEKEDPVEGILYLLNEVGAALLWGLTVILWYLGYEFINSIFNKCLISTYHVPDIVLDIEMK